MTNAVLVARKLATIEEHLRRLKERRPSTSELLERDTLLQDAIAMGILVLVQEAMDVALHIASDEGWTLASTYREAFGVLAQHGIIDDALASTLATTAQLRNRIAHGYATVDVARIWAELPAGIGAFESFSSAVAKFLASLPADDG